MTTIDVWYTHELDNFPIRRLPQMTAPIRSKTDPVAEIDQLIAELQTQGYIVQKVERIELCPTCLGCAQVAKRPGGTARKAEWTYGYRDCTACKMTGEVSRTVYFVQE